jgi:hypothetical protein
VGFDRSKACEFSSFYSNRYTFIRLFAPNYLRFILLNMYNNVYYINLTWKLTERAGVRPRALQNIFVKISATLSENVLQRFCSL